MHLHQISDVPCVPAQIDAESHGRIAQKAVASRSRKSAHASKLRNRQQVIDDAISQSLPGEIRMIHAVAAEPLLAGLTKQGGNIRLLGGNQILGEDGAKIEMGPLKYLTEPGDLRLQPQDQIDHVCIHAYTVSKKHIHQKNRHQYRLEVAETSLDDRAGGHQTLTDTACSLHGDRKSVV